MFFSRWWLIFCTALLITLHYPEHAIDSHSVWRPIFHIVAFFAAIMVFVPLGIAFIRTRTNPGENKHDNLVFVEEYARFVIVAFLLGVVVDTFVSGHIVTGIFYGILVAFCIAMVIASWKLDRKKQSEP
jgi:ABC-type Fe3+ transport system permease subunit